MQRQFKVTVNGREYDVSVLELTPGAAAASPPPASVAPAPVAAAPVPTAAAANVPAAAAGDIVAGMGGVVVEIHCKVGQAVAVGDRLLTLEAMKMKTPIVANRAGQIARVLVAPNEAVESGQALVTIA
jgi:biotin carboxyl carrier protein